MDVLGRWSTWTRRMAASVAACSATLLIVATVAGQEATLEEAGAAINAPAEGEILPLVLAEEPFQVTVAISMNQVLRSASALFVVPVGKRLVVENLAGRGAAPGIQSVILGQSNTVAVLPPKITNTSWNWIGTTPTKVIFNAGTVIVTIARPAAVGTCTTCPVSNYVTITGYLIAG